jgi:hypothetical protein
VRGCGPLRWLENAEQLSGIIRRIWIMAQADKMHTLRRFQQPATGHGVVTVAPQDLLGDSQVQTVYGT